MLAALALAAVAADSAGGRSPAGVTAGWGQPPEERPPPGQPPSEDPLPGEDTLPPGEAAAPGEGPGDEVSGEDDQGSKDEEADPEGSGSRRAPDVAAAPVGILPGRLLAAPAPDPGAPVVGMVLDADGFFLHTAGGAVIAYYPDGEVTRWGLPGARAVFLATNAGKLVVLDDRGDVALRDPVDGKRAGGFSTGRPPDRGAGAETDPLLAPATLAAGVLYWVSGGTLHGYEAATGNAVLEAALPEGEAVSVVAVSRPADGSLPAAGNAPPLLLVSLGSGGVAAVSGPAGTIQGAVRWHVGDTGRVTGAVLALADEGLAVFGDARGDLHAVDLETGRRRWRWRLAEGFHHPPLASRGRLYAATKANSLYCFDAKRGGERWRAALPGRPAASPIRMAGVILVVTQDGLLVEVNAETGARIGRPRDLEAEVLGVVRRQADGAREDGWRDRRLFLGLRDGRLAVFGPRTGSGDS